MTDEQDHKRYLEDPATDPEAAATIDDLIARGRKEFEALSELVERSRAGDHDLPSAIEHVGSLIEVLGEARPHIENRGQREDIAVEVLKKTGVDGPVAEVLVAVAKGLVRLWRKRRDSGAGGTVPRVRMGLER